MTTAGEARLLLLGWNFRTAALSVRERVAFSGDEVREALDRIRREGLVSESVIVSTCNRSEIYGVSEGSGAGEGLTRCISEWRGLDFSEAAAGSFVREGEDAARHLFRVAAGLESLALGESEVLGQVRSALRVAREAGATRAVLHRMFETRGRRRQARPHGNRDRPPSSLDPVDRLRARDEGLRSARGANRAGARRGRDRERSSPSRRRPRASGTSGSPIAVTSGPTASRAGSAAGPCPGRTSRAALPEADVVVGTTASPTPVVSRADVEAAMRERRGRPMFFLDLAMPRDFEAGVADLYNVYLFGLDDLGAVAEENRRRRGREIPLAEAILEEELGRFLAWFGNLAVVPTLNALRSRLAALRDAELDRLPAEERERFRAFADAIAAKLLHEPLRRLKSETDASRKLDRVEAVRHLFDLDS